MEEWKDIDEFYAVSNYGNVKSKERIITQPYSGKIRIKKWKEKLLTKQPSPEYLRVKLHNKYVSLSHLVAKAFIPNPNNYSVVHHKDKDFTNNRVENLEWMDNDKHDKLHSDEKCKIVYQYSLDGKLINVWNSTHEVEKGGFNQGHVSDCCIGKRKTHKGYLWFHTPMN